MCVQLLITSLIFSQGAPCVLGSFSGRHCQYNDGRAKNDDSSFPKVLSAVTVAHNLFVYLHITQSWSARTICFLPRAKIRKWGILIRHKWTVSSLLLTFLCNEQHNIVSLLHSTCFCKWLYFTVPAMVTLKEIGWRSSLFIPHLGEQKCVEFDWVCMPGN